MAQVLATNPTGSYTFASQPRAVQQRKKYKETWIAPTDDYSQYGNIMYDRRVIRGNTYALNTLPAVSSALDRAHRICPHHLTPLT